METIDKKSISRGLGVFAVAFVAAASQAGALGFVFEEQPN
jgi:hypothetical protein